MNQNDIRRIYTEKVAGLLAKGYVLHPETMGGSQGEMARIDLTNGSKILQVLINRVGGCSDSYGEIYAIIIGRCTEKYSGYQHTIWNDRLEILSEIKLDQISDNFYTTPEEGKRMSELRFSRWKRRKCENRRELGDAYKSVALRWLRRQPRMKTCKLEDIDHMIRRTQSDGTVCYEIEAKGKTFCLHP